jgi:hypothetical protein
MLMSVSAAVRPLHVAQQPCVLSAVNVVYLALLRLTS